MRKRVILAALLLIATFASSEADYRLECPKSRCRSRHPRVHHCHRWSGHQSAARLCQPLRCIRLKGAYARARTDCEQAIEFGGEFAAAYLIRGIHYAEQRDNRAAVETGASTCSTCAGQPAIADGECLRLWQPETRASLQEWRGICRRLDFGPGRTHGTI